MSSLFYTAARLVVSFVSETIVTFGCTKKEYQFAGTSHEKSKSGGKQICQIFNCLIWSDHCTKIGFRSSALLGTLACFRHRSQILRNPVVKLSLHKAHLVTLKKT